MTKTMKQIEQEKQLGIMQRTKDHLEKRLNELRNLSSQPYTNKDMLSTTFKELQKIETLIKGGEL